MYLTNLINMSLVYINKPYLKCKVVYSQMNKPSYMVNNIATSNITKNSLINSGTYMWEYQLACLVINR